MTSFETVWFRSGFASPVFRGISGVLTGVFFLWLALRQTSLTEVTITLAQVHLAWIFLGIFFYLLDLAMRAIRWRGLLRNIVKISYLSAWNVLVVGYAVNNILPARLGELYRAHFAGKQFRVSRSAAFASIVVERLLDGIFVLLALLMGMWLAASHPLIKTLAITCLLSLVFLVVVSVSVDKRFIRSLCRWPYLIEPLERFSASFRLIFDSSFWIWVVASIVIWVFEGMAIWSVLKAVGMSVDCQGMMLVVGIASLSTMMPSAPGFVGTYQYAYAFVVSQLGYESAIGIAAATAVQVFLMGGLTLIGMTVFVFHHLNKRPDIYVK